jgi:hypothetical protein
MPTAAFRLSGGASVPVAYTESRGVLVSARVGGRDMRAAVDTLATFRDGTGRRMPAILAAAAIAIGTNRASAHATTPSGTELQIRHVVDAESGKDTEYAAVHHGLEYTYAVRETMLDRLFAKVVPSGACPGALFEGNEEIRSGWLSTDHIHLFWVAVVAHMKARVICVDTAAHNFSSDPTAYTRMALGLGKSIGKMQGDEQVWLFPINISNAHHTFARVVYQRSTGSVVLTHYDSLNANVRASAANRMCDFIISAFQHALPRARTRLLNGAVQQQGDGVSCGPFVCIGLLLASQGKEPRFRKRVVNDEDIRRVRCIVATEQAKWNARQASGGEPKTREIEGGVVLILDD